MFLYVNSGRIRMHYIECAPVRKARANAAMAYPIRTVVKLRLVPIRTKNKAWMKLAITSIRDRARQGDGMPVLADSDVTPAFDAWVETSEAGGLLYTVPRVCRTR